MPEQGGENMFPEQEMIDDQGPIVPEYIVGQIDDEIRRANAKWRVPGREGIERQYNFWAPHLILLEEKLSRIRMRWYNSHDEEEMYAEVVKIAAIAIRALMEVGSTKTTDVAAATEAFRSTLQKALNLGNKAADEDDELESKRAEIERRMADKETDYNPPMGWVAWKSTEGNWHAQTVEEYKERNRSAPLAGHDAIK